MLGKLKRIGGSSVGAICAGLLAVGCTPQEIADVFSPDVKWLFQGNLLQMVPMIISWEVRWDWVSKIAVNWDYFLKICCQDFGIIDWDCNNILN